MQPDKAGTAPVFPADHFAGTKADRVMATKDGLTAWEAIQLLFPKPEPIKDDLDLWSGGMTWVDTEMWWAYAWPSFQDLLREDSWYARGFLEPVDPTPCRERIRRGLWDILDIDLDDNTASGGGLKYAGLRFYEKKKVGKSLSREPVRRADLKRFMKKRIAALKETGGRSSAREDETAAREHFEDRSINRDWIKEIRQEIGVPPDWLRRGPRN